MSLNDTKKNMNEKNNHSAKTDNASIRKQYWFVIRELTDREIKRKYARSKLGIVWSILNPLLYMIVMSLVFSYMFRRSIENFPIYFLIGHVVWDLYGEATRSSMTAIVDNKSLILRTKLPKQTFILSRIYTAFVNFLFTLVPLVCMLVIFKIHISWKVLLVIPDIMLILLFATGIGYILAVLYVFLADIKHLYGIFMTLLMYLSAIFYPAKSLPEFMQQLVTFNPVYLAIDIARHLVLYNLFPYYTEWIKLAIYAVLAFGLGLYIYKKKENIIVAEI